jgi:preprotein translocase SecF subunit
MIPIHFIPDDTKIPFLKWRNIAIGASLIGVVAAIVLFLAAGLNYGIDFRGGTLIQIKTPQAADIGALRGQVGGLGLGDVEIQEFGAPNEVLIRLVQQPGGDVEQQQAVNKVKAALGDTVEYERVEVVGAKVSGELVQEGIIAVLVAIVAVLIYIWFRFEWQFSVGAVVALVHDVMLTIGLFSLLQLDFNLSIIAAILTIVGYSLNDTVVVFDRVRENLRKYKRTDLAELLNMSINDTLSRTILTSGTTLIALGSLYIFGGEVIRGFTFAMIWGVVIGTYSSIFIASPLLLYLGVKRDWSGQTGGGKAEKAAAAS